MRVIFENETIEDNEIVLDEIVVQLIGLRDEEKQINDYTLQKMIENIRK